MKKVFLIMILVLSGMFGTQAYAQTDDQCLKSLELTSIELQKEKAKNEALVEKDKVKDALITTLQNHIATLNSIIKNLDEQLGKEQKIDTKSQMIIDNLRLQVSDLKDELNAVRRERDKAKTNGNIKAVIGFGAGLTTGRLIK